MCTRQRPGAHEGRAGGRLLGRKERGLAHPGRRPTVAGADASSLVVSSHKTVIVSVYYRVCTAVRGHHCYELV